MVMRHGGMALLMVLLLVAVVAMVSATMVVVGAQEERRNAEEELVFVGMALQSALRSYVNSSQGEAVLGPMSLDDLLRDPRFAGIRRHLRCIPVDPLTGRAQWGLAKAPGGQIVGVYSLASGVPIKRDGFEPPLQNLNDAENYQAWIFGVVPVASPLSQRR